jgi:methionyl-tRNA formyltransferase
MKLIFFGAGDFAFPIAKKVAHDFDLLGVVVTKPRPRGRGRTVTLPEVARWAQAQGIQVFTPDKPDSADFIHAVTDCDPDLYVLSSYGYILSGNLLRIPRYGGVNVHPSLLPQYRGAAPIQRTLMAGETKTGITVIFMDEKVDHGKIVFQREVAIESDDNYGSLTARLSSVATEAISDIIRSIASGSHSVLEQNHVCATYAPKIKKEEMIINWQSSTGEIIGLIRALSPKPCARTQFRGRTLKIIAAEPGKKSQSPGTLHLENKKLYAGTGNGSIVITRLQPENKSVISSLDFINGFRIQEGEAIG